MGLKGFFLGRPVSGVFNGLIHISDEISSDGCVVDLSPKELEGVTVSYI